MGPGGSLHIVCCPPRPCHHGRVALLPGAEPFAFDGAEDCPAVLLCHGFTGSPQSLLPWGEHLAGQGFTVHCPRLPGHGSRWQDMNKTRWPDWYDTLDTELLRLRKRGQPVVVGGLSMGGTLALRLAELHPEIAGLVLVNPSLLTERKDAKVLPLLSRVVPSLAGVANDIAKPGAREVAYDRLPLKAAASLQQLWKVTRADLAKVTMPVLLYRSVNDHVVEPASARLLHTAVGSADLTEVVLERSYHVATLDHEAPTIFDGSADFIRRVSQR